VIVPFASLVNTCPDNPVTVVNILEKVIFVSDTSVHIILSPLIVFIFPVNADILLEISNAINEPSVITLLVEKRFVIVPKEAVKLEEASNVVKDPSVITLLVEKRFVIVPKEAVKFVKEMSVKVPLLTVNWIHPLRLT
jgi:hypothetical protein